MGLLTEYPSWFILLCLLLGAMYSFSLYFRGPGESPNPWLSWLMAALRFLAVFLISFLLLSPLIRQNLSTVEKPVIIIGQDNSQSLLLGRDSSFVTGAYLDMMEELKQTLARNYDVRTYSFDADVTSPMESDFMGKVTDISRFFSEITTRYLNRNVGAVIMASDGISNFGPDPFYAASDLPYTLYTVGLGDTTDRRDITISKVLYNRQVFLGDEFPMEIQVDAIRCDGERVTLQVKENRKVLASVEITLRGASFSRQVPVKITANESGWHRYSIELTPVGGEVSHDNNRRDVFIEVLDVRTRVLLVYDSPHPDIGAIREALAANEKYEVAECSPEEFLLEKDSAALVIFYQVPSARGIRIAESVISKLPSALFVLGSQSDIPAFNRMATGMVLSMQRVTYTEAYPVLVTAFPYFSVNQDLARLIQQFSPLQSPFGAYQYSPLTEVLAYQKISGVTTRFPLICFTQTGDQKRGFITGENFWRWRITNFEQTGDFIAFDELMQKIVQYLSVKQDRSLFKVRTKSEYLENEAVEIEAEVFNQSYEPINESEVTITITDESGTSFPFTFGQTGSAYFLRVGTFPPGVYTYHASVIPARERLEKRGSFVVAPVNLEAVNLTANHNLLFRLAESHRGKLINPQELLTLPDLIRENEEIHAISYVQRIFSELINAPWVFLLILAFLTGEWALRKYTGL